jgi:hypothetical protein
MKASLPRTYCVEKLSLKQNDCQKVAAEKLSHFSHVQAALSRK